MTLKCVYFSDFILTEMLKEYYSYMRYEVDYLLVNLVGRKGGAIHDEKVLYRVNNPHSKIG